MVTDGIASQVVGQAVGQSGAQPASTGGSAANVLESFNAAFMKAQHRQSAAVDAGGLESLLSPLLSLGERSAELESQLAPLGSSDLRPSELMMVTMRSHEFLFRCELTANVANRASDGVQQLFRQQS